MGEIVQSLAQLSGQSVRFVVCEYINSVFYGGLRSRYALIRFATPVEAMSPPMMV